MNVVGISIVIIIAWYFGESYAKNDSDKTQNIPSNSIRSNNELDADGYVRRI
jgi:hypothetical protein